ncbi:putative xenobiotic-transporting ATPase [Rosa chinensis]|uniref:Putative xenobiotic-transporting ATPase n=1 Tax=Rosa chinensis TaxID=74649 RepID=A0A2P6SGB5_ROSCH|nr:putative xenobiotic-transporting ATPase [Rosa chinensis]
MFIHRLRSFVFNTFMIKWISHIHSGVKLQRVMGHIQFINIDGIPIRELDIRWLRGKVGFVLQEPNLFHMTIKSNIKYGCSDDIKEEDIKSAAKLAYAHNFISSLPDGYDTLVDDNLLGGGQKQWIAIASAILRDPAILILDEATSALDSEAEHHIKACSFKTRRIFPFYSTK